MNRTLTLLKRLPLIALLTVASLATAMAGPATPVDLKASVTDGINGGKYINLSWGMPDPAPFGHEGFNVFMGVAQGGFIYFRQIAQVEDSSGAGKGYYTMPVNASATYSFYVTSYAANESSPSSDTISLEVICDPVGGGNAINFDQTSYYAKGAPNQPLSFTVHGTAANGNAIWYGLGGDAPQGVAIDDTTGEVTWTPTTAGTYVFNVVAGYQGEDSARGSVRCTVDINDGIIRTNITGFLLDSAGNSVMSGTVKLYTEVGNPNGVNTFEFVEEFPVRQGYFSFTATEFSVYILEGIPDDSTLAAAYYKENALGVTNWQDATRITASPNGGANTPVKFHLPYADGHHGSNRLKGVVYNGSGKSKDGSDVTLLGTTPLADAFVYAIDPAGRVSSFTVTGATGEFTLRNLGAGAYTVYINKIGFKGSTTVFTFPDDSGTELDYGAATVDPIQGVSSVPVDVATGSSISVAPNPVLLGSTSLSFTAKGGAGTLRVVTSSGETVRTRNIETVAGSNSIDLSTEGLAGGYYLVQVLLRGETLTVPVVVR